MPEDILWSEVNLPVRAYYTYTLQKLVIIYNSKKNKSVLILTYILNLSKDSAVVIITTN